jgi:hypothetical protein
MEIEMSPEEFIARYMKTESFYHFTDTRNLDLIQKSGGLLSLRELRKRKIVIPAPGGNDWSHDADEMRGLDSYVHLCLRRQHPMEYVAKNDGRIQESVFLRINRDIVRMEGVRFTPDVSNKANVPILTLEEASKTMDFSVVYDRTDWRDPEVQRRLQAADKFELLVPVEIPIKFFL